MRHYIIFGPPGAGKGTQSVSMVRDFNLCHLSTGDLLRAEIAAQTDLGRQAKSLIDAGNFVPDSVVEEIIRKKFDSEKDVSGFLLDGFPRTISQAEDLDAMLSERGESVTKVISLMIPDETVRARICHRAAIEGRVDDASDEIINNRIRTYHEKTEPLIAYYEAQGKYFEVSGDRGPGESGIAAVYEDIRKVMQGTDA